MHKDIVRCLGFYFYIQLLNSQIDHTSHIINPRHFKIQTRLGDGYKFAETLNYSRCLLAYRKQAQEQSNEDKDKDKPAGPVLAIDTETKLPPVRSTFGANKGTVFLVDPKSHQVLWSVYDPAKGSGSKEMDRTASDIVSRLKKDMNPKK